MWVDKNGHKLALPVKPQSYCTLGFRPTAASWPSEVEGASHDIFTSDFARAGEPTKMSFDGASHWPSWTPDRQQVDVPVLEDGNHDDVVDASGSRQASQSC